MSKPVVVGVDPGGRFTGIIARHGPDLLAHWLTRRTVDGGRHTYTLAGYIALVLDDLADLAEAKRRALTHAGPDRVRQILRNEGGARERCYELAARRLHPDAGGDHEQFTRLQAAKRVLDQHAGGGQP